MSQSLFHVADDHLSEKEKILLRQEKVDGEVVQSSQSSVSFSDLFNYSFDPEVAAKKNCENVIGSIEVPVGVAGPVSIHSDVLREDVFLPFATTEGALVASVSRGVKAIQLNGGSQVVVNKIGMSRAPIFRCVSGAAAQAFVAWMEQYRSEFVSAAESTSQHLKYLSHLSWVRGHSVYIRFVFDTDEAMGMNMISIALQTAWEKVKSAHAEELKNVELLALSSNVCCDKKDSVINRILGRGYWAQAEVVLSRETIETVLKTTPEKLLEVHIAKNLVGSNVAGSFSQSMQVGNVIAAMYLATGQDIAQVTEGSQASTTFEADEKGVYVAVTLPNIDMGTVGGGTWFPKQTQARQLIRKGQNVTAAQLAAAIATACLAAEISGMAALASQTLAQAHQKLGRI
jgi:hydroxymethylglutaryl-CoA reductase (NADPH)